MDTGATKMDQAVPQVVHGEGLIGIIQGSISDSLCDRIDDESGDLTLRLENGDMRYWIVESPAERGD